MNPAKADALHMRIAGHSYNEINAKLGVPKSTLSVWLRDVILSEKAQTRLHARVHQGVLNGFVKRNKLQTHEAQKRAKLIRETAQNDISIIAKEDLKLIGVALYWAEGYKRLVMKDGKERTGHAISFVNSDPEMVKIFMRFLRQTLEVRDDEFRIAMRLYPNINEKVAMKYWMNVINLNKQNFTKTTYLISSASKQKRPFNRLPHGTLQVAVYDTKKFHRIMGWIEGMKNRA